MKTLPPFPSLLLLLPLVLTACGGSGDPAPAKPPAASAPATTATVPVAASTAATAALLGGHHWRLIEASDRAGTRIDALLVRPDAPVQLDFVDGRVGVSNTCNRMSGAYTLDGERLTTAAMAATQMACADPAINALDAAVGQRLEGTVTAQISAGEPPRLTLVTRAGERLVFAGHPTAATRFGGTPERLFLEVAAETKPCSHPLIPDSQCLQVRELRYDDNGLKAGEPGDWRHFYEPIEGYTHEAGIRNVLRVDRYTRTDVPADASRHAYVLDMVVESESVQR